MTRLSTTMAALGAAALLAACAQKQPAEPAPEAAMPAPAPMMETPSEAAQPIVLTQSAMPDGGTLESGTLVTGADGWAVHGESDGIAWRYGSSDHGYLRVANAAGTEWQHIQVAESWSVLCKADPAMGSSEGGGAAKTYCDVLHAQPVEPNTMTTGGIRVADHGVCAVTDNRTADATLVVDAGAPHTLVARDLCEPGDALTSELLAGNTATLTAMFAPKGQPQTISFPTTGLKQALALRDWIEAKAKAGELKAE
jgi:hypothetical protein